MIARSSFFAVTIRIRRWRSRAADLRVALDPLVSVDTCPSNFRADAADELGRQ